MPKRKQQEAEQHPSSEEEEQQSGSGPGEDGSASGGSGSEESDSGSDSDAFPSGAESSGSESSDDEAGEAFEQVGTRSPVHPAGCAAAPVLCCRQDVQGVHAARCCPRAGKLLAPKQSHAPPLQLLPRRPSPLAPRRWTWTLGSTAPRRRTSTGCAPCWRGTWMGSSGRPPTWQTPSYSRCAAWLLPPCPAPPSELLVEAWSRRRSTARLAGCTGPPPPVPSGGGTLFACTCSHRATTAKRPCGRVACHRAPPSGQLLGDSCAAGCRCALPGAARRYRPWAHTQRMCLLAGCSGLLARFHGAAGPLSLQGAASGVGSVIKCGEEDDPIGVSTVLSLARHGAAQPLKELRAFLLAAAGGHRERLEKVGAPGLEWRGAALGMPSTALAGEALASGGV